jgi:hypothetical protein
MADIVDLAIARGQRLWRGRGQETACGPAQIVLYPGIRYERQEEKPLKLPRRTARKKRKRKNKNS